MVESARRSCGITHQQHRPSWCPPGRGPTWGAWAPPSRHRSAAGLRSRAVQRGGRRSASWLKNLCVGVVVSSWVSAAGRWKRASDGQLFESVFSRSFTPTPLSAQNTGNCCNIKKCLLYISRNIQFRRYPGRKHMPKPNTYACYLLLVLYGTIVRGTQGGGRLRCATPPGESSQRRR